MNNTSFKDVNIVVKGLVQGIGYRPFVACNAEKLGVKGWVKNTAGIVTIRAIADSKTIDTFLVLIKKGPTGARVESMEITDSINLSDENEFNGFSIIESEENVITELPYIPEDISICDNCIQELIDPDNRRYMHPFISCTACGPRYSIIEKLPYDRETITMKKFDLCPICSKEYIDKDDRRRHAQTIACRECGPRLTFVEISKGFGSISDDLCAITGDDEALHQTSALIKQGGVAAVKDIGGYHLVCLAGNSKAVDAIRELKNRERKPFAVCFNNVEEIKKYALVNDKEEAELISAAKPIVLLKKKSDMSGSDAIAENVCENSPYIGAMLPCNAIQYILTKKLGPLVMTSANASKELMITDNERMVKWLDNRKNMELSLGVLSNDRDILTPLDDSIVQVIKENNVEFRQIIRRARGFVPGLIKIDNNKNVNKDNEAGYVFATGGDLKATFAVGAGNKVLLSQNFGDLEDEEIFKEYKKEIKRSAKLFGVADIKSYVTDMHPGYRAALEVQENRPIKVLHHVAHVASVIAEKRLQGKMLGVAFDGTGYGNDGTIWGGEFFGCNISSDINENVIERIGHLKTVKMIGGNEGAKNAESILYGMMHEYGLEGRLREIVEANPQDIFKHINLSKLAMVSKALDMGINTVQSSSMGRLFDAVSALLGVCMYNSYEGEAPIELQYLAETTKDEYPLVIDIVKAESRFVGDCKRLFGAIVEAIEQGKDNVSIARGFIKAVAEYIVKMAEITGYDRIVLSGGTFANRILMEYVIMMAEEAGIQVYVNELVPCGDGGLALGQVYIEKNILFH